MAYRWADWFAVSLSIVERSQWWHDKAKTNGMIDQCENLTERSGELHFKWMNITVWSWTESPKKKKKKKKRVRWLRGGRDDLFLALCLLIHKSVLWGMMKTQLNHIVAQCCQENLALFSIWEKNCLFSLFPPTLSLSLFSMCVFRDNYHLRFSFSHMEPNSFFSLHGNAEGSTFNFFSSFDGECSTARRGENREEEWVRESESERERERERMRKAHGREQTERKSVDSLMR